MSVRQSGYALGIFLIVISAITVYGDVKIVRKLPDTSVNQAKAVWSASVPDAKKENSSFGKPKLSGRLSFGGSGGIDLNMKEKYDFFTDSKLSFLQPFGTSGVMQLSAAAFRKNIIGGLSQKYSGALFFKISDLSLKIKGIYDDNSDTVDEILRGNKNLNLDASLSIGFLDTLPIIISYNHVSGLKTEDANAESSGNEVISSHTESDKARLEMAGTAGNFGLSFFTALQNQKDMLNDVNSISFSNNISITSPLIGFLKIRASISPEYDKVEYVSASNTVATTALNSELGFNIPVNKELLLDIYGGRIDSWVSREGPNSGISGIDYNPYSAAWTAGTGIAYKNDNGLEANSKYKIKTGAGLFDQDLTTSSSFRGSEESFLRDAELKGEFAQQYGENSTLNSNKLNWAAGTKLSPAEEMLLSASYQGSVSAEGKFSDSFLSWTNAGKASFIHSPSTLVDYQLSASLTDTNNQNASLVKQQYGGKISFKPRKDLKEYLFGIGEDIMLSNGITADENTVISTMTYTMGIPVLDFLKTRYNLKWEWTAAEYSPSENNFQHLFGLTLSGSSLPLSFTTDYLLSHGYRGVRHDVNSSLSVPLWGSFAVEGRFSLSYYKEDGIKKMPFLIGINASYQF